jgi:dolichol kinase
MTGLVFLGLLELVRRKLHISNEDSRKAYHIVHALIIGAASFLVSYDIIILLELALLGTMLFVRTFRLFEWLYNVGRISWGEYFGVAGVIIISLIAPNKWVFLAAMLHLGFADAVAALIGKRYGKNYQFKVFGQIKSLPGSLAFYIASIAITTIVIVASQSNAGSLVVLALLPLLATLAETSSPFGADNLVLPVLVVLVLNALGFAT